MDKNGAKLLNSLVADAVMGLDDQAAVHRYQAAGEIAKSAWNISDDGGALSMEFLGGQQFKYAAEAAWHLLFLGQKPVRFRFNGVEVTLTNTEA